MPLTIPQIREILQSPKRKKEIRRAVDHENRLRFHCDVNLSLSDAGRAGIEYYRWVDKLLPTDKAERFKDLFSWPHPVVKETKKAFSDLEKVLDGRNPVFDLHFTNPDAKEEALLYLSSESRKDRRKKAFHKMTIAPSSVLVVDTPRTQESSRKEPYHYYLNIGSLIDFDIDDDANIIYLIFPQPEGFVCIDDAFFHFFECKEKDYLNAIHTETIAHNYESVPATFPWYPYAYDSNKSLKINPISSYLGDLDWLLFLSVCEKHTDLVSGFPIEWFYEQDQDEKEERNKDRENGILPNGEYSFFDRVTGRHLNSKKHPMSGPGGVIDTPIPDSEEGIPSLAPPGGTIERNAELVRYIQDKVRKLKNEFHECVTGYSGEPDNNQAKNEKQVGSIYETRKAILNSLARHFEKSEKWLIETKLKIRYPESFLSASISYGTEYYLEDANQILDRVTKAKKEEASQIVIGIEERQYFETKYRNNPEMIERVNLLNQLDPAIDTTRSEVERLFEIGGLSAKDYIFKKRFSSLIAQFERENGTLSEFGINIESETGDNYSLRVQRIKDIIYSYIEEPVIAGD